MITTTPCLGRHFPKLKEIEYSNFKYYNTYIKLVFRKINARLQKLIIKH